MAKFEPGHEKKGGRKKGVQNSLTKTVKEAVLEAFNEIQNDPKANLLEWGKKNPHLFYPIAAKLIPAEINAHVDNKTIIVKVQGEDNDNNLAEMG